MKYFLIAANLLFTNLLFSQISEKDIIGEWSIISETYSNCKKAERNITNLSKNEDGCLTSAVGITSCAKAFFKGGNKYSSTITFNGDEMIQQGTYKISGDKLTITLQGFPKEYNVSYNNNQLILTTTLLGCDYKTISKKK